MASNRSASAIKCHQWPFLLRCSRGILPPTKKMTVGCQCTIEAPDTKPQEGSNAIPYLLLDRMAGPQ